VGSVDSLELTDAEIIEASIGQSSTFDLIIRRHFQEIFKFLARRIGDEASDLAAETFVIAFKARAKYDVARSDARPWLYGIANNMIRRHRRSEIRKLNAYSRLRAPVMDDESTSAVDRLDTQSEFARVVRAFASLSEDRRDALYLVGVAGLSYEDAAVALQIKPGTLHSRVSRAREELRDLMSLSGEVRGKAIPRDQRQEL
jgi:RNA polymerase sigma-70 factor (ECF subfamily)